MKIIPIFVFIIILIYKLILRFLITQSSQVRVLTPILNKKAKQLLGFFILYIVSFNYSIIICLVNFPSAVFKSRKYIPFAISKTSKLVD